MRPADVLAWLQENGARIVIQALDPDARQKNKVILTYRGVAGELNTVGGRTLYDAVVRAEARLKAVPRSGVVTIPTLHPGGDAT